MEWGRRGERCVPVGTLPSCPASSAVAPGVGASWSGRGVVAVVAAVVAGAVVVAGVPLSCARGLQPAPVEPA